MAPNIVLIQTDTQATNAVGCYGYPELRTHAIDQLAEEGILFERAYTTCPVCTPARAALYSGIYAHTSGPWTNNIALGANIRTMGQLFQEAGYHTAHVGKWHLDGHDYFGTGYCPEGWDPDYWYDGRNYLDELSDEEIALWRHGMPSYEDLVKNDVKAEFTWAHRVSNRAIDFLKADRDTPFLLAVDYDEPHHPFTCPPEFVEPFLDYRHPLGSRSEDSLESKPVHQREWAAAAEGAHDINGDGVSMPMYFGCNAYVDHEIGRVLDAVREFAPEDTWVIYTSDHGDFLGGHRLNLKGAAPYDDIARIPFIVRRPGGEGGGRRVNQPMSHIHALPTIMEIAGIDAPPILEGESQLELLQGGEEDGNAAAVIEFNRYEIEHDSFGGFQPVRCIVCEGWKLVLNLLHTDELYHLDEDPDEMVNHIDDEDAREIRDRLHDRLLTWMNEKRDPFRGTCWERRPWRDVKTLNMGWMGPFRARPADGVAPTVLDYNTGLPAGKPREQETQGK
ncbi:MAG: sulfatase-like hydrolase/transferase [Planctomycetota bacterium]|jgi:uncharacterized sulfatase